MSKITREELEERARKLAPAIAERARECEQLRRLPDETIAEFKREGLLRAFVPPAYGGYGLPIGTVIGTSRAIARACGNSGWCLAICTLHNHMVSAFPEATLQSVFGSNPDAVVCGVFMPGGQARKVDGGVRVSGAWDFASTCDHSDHAVLAALLVDSEGGPPTGMATVLVDRDQFSIEDNWHVSGLCGTGSKRVIVDDLFVPADRMLSAGEGEAFTGRSAGSGTGRESDGLPGNSVATLGLTGVALGVAEGALDHFRERLATKVRVVTGKTPEQQIGAQLRYAASAAEVDAAALLVERDLDEMTADARAGRKPTMEQRGRYRRDAAWVMKTCAEAVARLQPAAGGHAVFLDDPMQRSLRDLQTMAAHIVADWDSAGEAFARAMIGLPPIDPVV
jgi:3-hydroxy-9,10-secoandrosta-1,3,5(10)-triene-9,17-dione monooxygenase